MVWHVPDIALVRGGEKGEGWGGDGYGRGGGGQSSGGRGVIALEGPGGAWGSGGYLFQTTSEGLLGVATHHMHADGVLNYCLVRVRTVHYDYNTLFLQCLT
jgi:hypothetical protein